MLNALRWGVGMRQVACADMVTADACRTLDDTIRLGEYLRDRDAHVPTVTVTVQGSVSRVAFEWKEDDHGE